LLWAVAPRIRSTTSASRRSKQTLFTTSAMPKASSSSTRCACDCEVVLCDSVYGSVVIARLFTTEARRSHRGTERRSDMSQIEIDKIGSATSPLNLPRTVTIVPANGTARAGDVVVVRVLTDNATYNMLELPTGRLAKVNPGDVLAGVLGRRRALKGFVGDVPETVKAGDELHLLNMGGVIGQCSGHHSSLNDAIKVEVLGLATNGNGLIKNIADAALPLRGSLGATAPLVVIAGACMNSGKTYAATEIIQLATRAGLRVAAAKLSGIACLRDTLNMHDHGAIATASFLDCGLPSTVGA